MNGEDIIARVRNEAEEWAKEHAFKSLSSAYKTGWVKGYVEGMKYVNELIKNATR